MNILHVGLCVDGKNEGLPHALNKISDVYAEMRPEPQKVLRAVRDMQSVNYPFDIAFFQIQAPNVIETEVFLILKKMGVFTINWSGDIRNNTEMWYYQTGADLTLFTNTRDVQNIREAGLNADFLQIGIDPLVFKEHSLENEGFDVVYMGNNYRNQFPEGHARVNMVHMLRNRYKNRFGLYGNGWNLGNHENNSNQLDQAYIYNNSKIAINHSQFNEVRYTSDRLFRILGSGCFCLSHHYKGIEQDFVIGKHLDTYHNLKELQEKIDYYLAHEKERDEIMNNAYDYCHNTFTYDHMIKNLIELYKKYR